jgi:NAD(P)H-flavin reductase
MAPQDEACGADLDPMLPEPFAIRQVRHETHDVFTFELVPRDGASARPAAPGQFNMLYVFGMGEVPISISSRAGEPLLHTIRAVGTVTRAMAQLKRNDVVGVRGPFGSHWPIDEARGKDLLMLAGGIGMAPLRGALLELRARRTEFGRIILIYGARTPADLLYARELERFRDDDIVVEFTVDRPHAGWRGHVGVVTTRIAVASFNPAHCVALMCGPEIMMRFATRELQKRGVSDQSIFLSLERNMKCAVGFCGHCQFGPAFICKDGPIFRHDRVASWLAIHEL